MQNPTLSVNFNLDNESGTYKYFNFTNTTVWTDGYDAANAIGYFKVTYPDGNLRIGSFDTPDVDGADVTYDGLLIPTVTNGGFMVGMYTFQLFIKYDNGVDPVEYFESAISSFLFDPCSGIFDNCTGLVKKACGKLTTNPFTQVLVWKDTTGYCAPTTITRSLSLKFFDGNGDAVEPPAINSPTLTYSYTWANVAYTFYINTLVTYVTDNVTVTIRVNLTYGYTIPAEYNLCSLINCYIAYVDSFFNRAAKLGGANLMPSTDYSDYIWLTGTVQALYQVIYCTGKESKAMSYYDDIKQFLAIKVPGCHCGCVDSTTPVQITPYNPATPTTYTFEGIDQIVVTVDESNHVTIGLDEDYLALLNALIAAGPAEPITSTDGSVTVSGSDLSIRNHMSVIVDIAPNAWPVTFTQSNFNRSGNYFKATINLKMVKGADNSVPANLAEYKASDFIIYINDFLTTALPGDSVVPDKIDIHCVQIIMADSDGTSDLSYPVDVVPELCGRDAAGFYLRLVDRTDGLIISGDRAVNTILSIKLTLKINH
jgi:hypothetical protein